MKVEIRIPNELAGQEARIKRFFDAMVYKLRQNAHKSGFEQADPAYCLKRLREEADELSEAIDGGNAIDTMLEAADCANFAMIAAAAAIERGHHVAPVVPSPFSDETSRRITNEIETLHAMERHDLSEFFKKDPRNNANRR